MSSSQSVARALADAMRQETVRVGSGTATVRGGDGRLAVVGTVGTDGTITTTDGIIARRLEMYRNPVVGDVIVLSVFSSGAWVAVGRQAQPAASDWTTYTPTVTNAGSATWTTRTGWWQRTGNGLVNVCVYLAVNAVGSGGGLVMVDMPTAVYRGTRQVLTMHTESVGPNGSHVGNGQAVFFTSGSGGTTDRLRTSSNDATNRDLNITGADLVSSGGTITIQGWYREA
ncbi:hypothetical protein [Streptomyces sp. NPDC002889]|uniref:hypothetical protein n=1 Tax=Streptomyces sp. NPDC002889 TaxID=3364669 RepID=UPI00368205CB